MVVMVPGQSEGRLMSGLIWDDGICGRVQKEWLFAVPISVGRLPTLLSRVKITFKCLAVKIWSCNVLVSFIWLALT